MVKTQPTNKREERAIFVLTCIQVMHIVDAMIIMPLGPQFMRIWLISPAQFALLVSAYTSCAAISAILCALFINRYDRKDSLICLQLGFVLSIVFCLFAKDYGSLLVARGIAGFFGGVLNAVVFAIVADLVPEFRRGTALGKIGIAFPVSSVAGVPIGLLLANTFDWHAPFSVLLALSIVTTTGVLFYIPPLVKHVPIARSQNPLKLTKLILTDQNQMRALLLISVLFLGGFSVIPFIAPYMVANVGLSEEELPLIYLFGGLAALFTSRVIGRFCDRYGKIKVFTMIALISIVPILVLTNLPRAPISVALLTSTCFMIFVSGRFIPAMAIVSAASQRELRGGFMSLNSAAQQIAMCAASLTSTTIVGYTVTGELTHYWILGLISIACTLLAVRVAHSVKVVD